ncbi:MAG TPA: sodium:proton antiporter [Pseudolabrys sp.]|nr:sodium:proton antiporter [Pseudolabrys sp.]
MPAATSIEIARHVLLSGALILAIGTIAALIAQRTKIPDVAMFPLVGILIGPQVLGFVDLKADSTLNQVILLFGASYILFDGGASLRFAVLKRVWITIVLLATAGVVITGAITAVAASAILGVPLVTATLLGAAIASTDPATLVPMFQQVHIRERIAQTVVSESALNDATSAIATFAVLGIATGAQAFSLPAALLGLVQQAGIGIIAGIVFGYAAAWLIAHERYGFLADYAPIVTLVAVIGAYFSADGLHSSGFTAVFVFGVMLGNQDAFGFAMPAGERRKLAEFAVTTAFILRLFIFILLGTQVDFALVGKYLVGGILVVAVFMLVARPLTVFICAPLDRRARWQRAELLFMCWTRETGVIPAALAGLLLALKVPGAEVIASVTFIAILMTLLIQAPTTEWLARRLRLLREG